jgi:hypothetical protein
MPRGPEEQLHKQLCQYLSFKYPYVMYVSDGSGDRLSRTQSSINKTLRSHSGWPDLFIAHPTKGYSGLYLELKRADFKVYRQNGELISNPHIHNQAATLSLLRERGYMAEFACGFDDAERIIHEYLD